MTTEEAKIYLPFSDSDEIEDFYQDKLFEFKHFFLIQAPIEKVFLAKLVKLEKLDLAYETLTKSTISKSEKQRLDFNFSDEIRNAFYLFEEEKSKFRVKISSAENGFELKQAVKQILDLVKAYRQKWAIGLQLDIQIDVLSKEPDSMEIHQAIIEFVNQGGVFFKDIIEQKNNPTLMKEMKRVSLLIEKY